MFQLFHPRLRNYFRDDARLSNFTKDFEDQPSLLVDRLLLNFCSLLVSDLAGPFLSFSRYETCNKSVSRSPSQAQHRVRLVRLDARRFRRIFDRLKKRGSCLFFPFFRKDAGILLHDSPRRERESGRFIIVATTRFVLRFELERLVSIK